MIERKIIPRELTLFEFFQENNLTLTVKLGEHTFCKKYVKMYVEGHTLFERVNMGWGRSDTIYPDFTTEEDSVSEVTRKMIDHITGEWICFNKKPVVQVPTLSYNTENWRDTVKIIHGPCAINFYDWLEKENLTLTISQCEDVNGKAFVRVELEGYGIVKSHVGNGIKLALAIEATESKAILKLIEIISEHHIAPSYRKSGWSCVNEDQKIKIPALR